MDERVMELQPLQLAFIWHMHQPDYRGSDGVMRMPWVFLHAIKDYYEMPWLLSRYQNLKATFNITSSLIEQLNLYRDPLRNDAFLALWERHPSSLTSEEKQWVIKICKSTQYETMVKPLKRFSVLYRQDHFSDEELIDLEVVFMLAWCGNYLRQNHPIVRRLLEQESGFIQHDKSELLHNLSEFTQTILPFYASLHNAGVISLSTTPYNHPILPLLLDVENGKRADEHITLPHNPVSLHDDAIEQVKRSIALYEKSFGTAPRGFWPAEGAVDEASIAIYKAHGLKWIATDEAILFKSLGDSSRNTLYRPYRFDDVMIGFRDHALSDLIGFTYRFKSAQDATGHFITMLESIKREQNDPTVFVILDGENAWEFFENNGYDFLTSLYHYFERTQWCKLVHMDEVYDAGNFGKLDQIAPGSWIQGNFNTWVGHPEKNRAWELIYQTKRDLLHHALVLDQERETMIRSHFLAAECSDWFWWYGDDHSTDFAYEFDALFREHLITIYHLLDMQPPSDLFEPIMTHKSTAAFLIRPHASITPLIDGKNGSFFEWLGAGVVDEGKFYSTMERVRGPIRKIYYGHDDDSVFLAFDGDVTSLKTHKLVLHVLVEENARQFTFVLNGSFEDESVRLCIDERVELALKRSVFGGLGKAHMRFDIVEENHIIQTLPGFGSLLVDMDDNYENNWFV
ncbi:glycoside hydrolase family 57 protein [Sulfuricurvum sp.]|uniref:glycoside hydrolase family 57 protein n=1 Tax=Sulfuricurvum sp. TaxID=2025608 RepID=UPI00260F23FE|nr:glycoside hydrolase family 57 protein [Sulfuricurvum sp.]MDD3596450.1 glycoside hydrolase family 57 protein [Sulfuricurvum sp.]